MTRIALVQAHTCRNRSRCQVVVRAVRRFRLPSVAVLVALWEMLRVQLLPVQRFEVALAGPTMGFVFRAGTVPA